MDKKSGFNIAYVVFAVLALLLLRDVWTQVRSVETVPYSTFEQYLREGKIEDVAVSERLITGRLKSPDEKGKTSIVAPLVEPAMAERLSHFGVTYTRTFEPTWLRELLSWVVPVLIFFGIWFVLARKFASGLGAGAVHKVSIIPHGVGALGYTLQRPSEDRLLVTRSELVNRIEVLLGGRAAEKLVFDELSTGAADDIAKATDIARSMAMRYGMDEGLGYVTYAENQPRFLDVVEGAPYRGCEASPETTQQIDAAVRRIVHTAFDSAIALLRENRSLRSTVARTPCSRKRRWRKPRSRT